MSIKVSAISAAESTLSALASQELTSAGVVLATHIGSVETLPSVLQRDQSDVVLLDFPVPDEKSMEKIEAALLKSPGTHMVLVSPDRSVEFLMRAMRAGVREVLPAPMTAMTVLLAVKHVHGRQSSGVHHRDHLGRVLALIPAKGGAGSTFLATNLAYALSRQGKRVALIDMNLYFGDAAMHLCDSKAVSSVADLARQTERLDTALLESSMIKVSEYLHVLAAPESPEDVDAVSAAGLEKIIELARGQYDFVILDVSSTLDPVTIKALDLADNICLTLQLNLPFVRSAKRMASVFRVLGYPPEKLSVIVNRYEKNGDITLADLEKKAILKVDRTIPNSHVAVSESINQGIPLLELAPRDPVALALRDWAQELSPTTQQQPVGWLQKLMKSSA